MALTFFLLSIADAIPMKKKKSNSVQPPSAPTVDFYITGCSDAPLQPAVWTEAMQSCSPLSRPPHGFAGTYFFPPPWILWAKDEKRRNRYFHNYIRIREYCLRRHFSEHINDLPKKIEYWREAVKGDYKQTKNLPESAAQALVTKNDTLPPTFATASNSTKRSNWKVIRADARSEFACNGELLPWNSDMVVIWKDREIRYDDLQDKGLREEVQYELYELNWRAELLHLDHEVSQNIEGTIDHLAKRKEMVGRVWNETSPGVNGVS